MLEQPLPLSRLPLELVFLPPFVTPHFRMLLAACFPFSVADADAAAATVASTLLYRSRSWPESLSFGSSSPAEFSAARVHRDILRLVGAASVADTSSNALRRQMGQFSCSYCRPLSVILSHPPVCSPPFGSVARGLTLLIISPLLKHPTFFLRSFEMRLPILSDSQLLAPPEPPDTLDALLVSWGLSTLADCNNIHNVLC